jgi:hypothetical protein
MRSSGWALAAVLFLGGLSAAARPAAAQVYNNGAPNGASGNEMTEWIQSEDFTLPATTDITGVRFWAFDFDPASYQGSITWTIYDNAGTNPGAILQRDNVVPTRVYDHNVASWKSYQYDFETGGVTLGPGTYWLGLHNGPLSATSRDNTYWETTDPNGTTRGNEDITPFDDASWYNNGQEHAFELFGAAAAHAPEPGSLALLASGGLPLFGLLRRRKRA